MDRRRLPATSRTTKLRHYRSKRLVAAAEECSNRDDHHSITAAGDLEPAIRPIGQPLRNAEVGRVHPAKVELLGEQGKNGPAGRRWPPRFLVELARPDPYPGRVGRRSRVHLIPPRRTCPAPPS